MGTFNELTLSSLSTVLIIQLLATKQTQIRNKVLTRKISCMDIEYLTLRQQC